MEATFQSIISKSMFGVLITTSALDATAHASSINRSFAEAFFISRRNDGSVEFIGSGVTWLLLILSMCAVGLMIHLVLSNRRSTVLPKDILNTVCKLIKRKQFQKAIDIVAKDRSFLSHILHAAFNEAKFGFPAMMKALEQTADERATARLRRIELLNVVGQVSPMIGLFGTVYGMIIAFGAIVAAGGSADPVALAGGIGTALTTTFWGLVVAIPALAGYAILRNRIDALTIEATIEAEHVLHLFRSPNNSQGESVVEKTVELESKQPVEVLT